MKNTRLFLLFVSCLVAMTMQAQTKACMSYDDFKADKWKSYEDLIPGKEPDSVRVKYDGMDFSLKTIDKEVNKVIKKDVFIMSIDNQLFINQRTLRDDDGVILPVNNYLRALPYKDGKLCVVCYHSSAGEYRARYRIAGHWSHHMGLYFPCHRPSAHKR